MVDTTRTATLDVVRCGAKTRKGSRCRHRAGERTTHVGQGKCWMHGGTKPGDPRLTHGRFSKVKRTRIAELWAQHAADPDPLNVLPELAMLRALFQDLIERYDETTEAVLAWHASWQLTRRPLSEDKLLAFEAVIAEWEIAIAEAGEKATEKQQADIDAAREFVKVCRGVDGTTKPRQLIDISDAYKILDAIGKMVERIERARSANAISRSELNRVIHEMGRVVDTLVQDDAIKAKIRDGWLALAV